MRLKKNMKNKTLAFKGGGELKKPFILVMN
jgi:hypothetical protein